MGIKTLCMIIIKRGLMAFIFLLLVLCGLIVLDYVPADFIDIAINVIFLCISLFLLTSLATLFISWLEYIRYWIFIDEKDLKIKKGLISTEEIGIPYRRIRDVKIKRSLLDQILGMSNVVIVLSDYGDNEPSTDESVISLPSLDSFIAREIQGNILKRSQVEQITILNGQKLV